MYSTFCLINTVASLLQVHHYLYSKWVEASPIPTKGSAGVAKFLYLLFCRHGILNKVQSDQGREFINSLSEDLFQLTGVKHIVSTAYHPQTNGLNERFDQTQQRSLLKMIEENEEHWENFLDSVLFAYRKANKHLQNLHHFLFCMGESLDFRLTSLSLLR